MCSLDYHDENNSVRRTLYVFFILKPFFISVSSVSSVVNEFDSLILNLEPETNPP